MVKPWKFSEKELKWLKANCTLPIAEYTEQFNKLFGDDKTKDQLHSFRKRNGWRTGRTGFYQKGEKPWNTGSKGVCKGSSTSFKKGQRPHNYMPVGTEAWTSDGYLRVKVSDKPVKWRYKGRMVWEEVNGPIPSGMSLIFIDGDHANCELSNLELVTRAELLRLNQNGYHKTPNELKPAVKSLSKLEVKVFSRSK